MKEIIITKAELKACKAQAKAATNHVEWYRSEAFYKVRDDLYAALLQKKAKMSNIMFDTNGGDLLYGDNIPRVVQLIHSEEGFTPEEYTRYTRMGVPNQRYGLIAEDPASGKVHAYEECGNISTLMSGNSFVEKGSLIKELWTIIDLKVKIV